MTAPQVPRSRPLFVFALATLLAGAGAASAQGTFDSSPEVQAAMKQLATQDPQVQKSRWGDLAAAADKLWLQATPGDVASVWRIARWVVPGAVMRYQRGFCIAIKCQGTDYLVQYNARAGQLEFFENGEMAYIGRIQGDGAVRLTGTGLIGVLTAETLKFDATSNSLFSDQHELKSVTAAQLATATRGFTAESTQAPAGSTVAAPPVAAASMPAAPASSSEAQLRAELAQMKAQLEALSKQVGQQTTTPAAAEPPAKQLTPAQAREEAARRAEAARLAREEAEARAAEARRLAAEKRAQEEEARRLAAEEKARAAQAKAAEAQRLAEEKRAAQEAERAAAAQAKAAPKQAAASQNACGGIDGIYGVVASNYRIEVKFEGDLLTVREPNRTSPYRHEGNCQYAFTHPNGTTYRMAVKPRALSAYKQDPSSATELALIQAHAAPQASGKCKLETIPVQNPQALHPGKTELFGVHAIPGVKLDGTYNAPEPNGRPMTVLGPNGVGGTFEVYGAPKPEYVYRIERWYIQANCDGTLIEESFPVANRYFLIFKLDRPYTGLEWHRMQFIVRKNEDRVSIDDRAKKKGS